MTPRLDDVEALARAVDRVVFPRTRRDETQAEPRTAAQDMISYLNESFPQIALPAHRRERVQRRLVRALGIPPAPSAAPWDRLEGEMNRRLRAVDPRWRPVVGGAAILLIGVLGFAYLRQRSAVKGVAVVSP